MWLALSLKSSLKITTDRCGTDQNVVQNTDHNSYQFRRTPEIDWLSVASKTFDRI